MKKNIFSFCQEKREKKKMSHMNTLKYIQENNPEILDVTLYEDIDTLVLLCKFSPSETRKVIIVALPECCDVNTFIFKTDFNILKNNHLLNIWEDPTPDEGMELYFTIHIYCSQRNILNFLREKSTLFRKLPKDIFNMISEKVGEMDFVFQRKNESNGYYSGYIEINIV